MAERPFSAYSGDAPYVFVSYAHHDAERVYPELTWLREQGINIWYDEGITPGSRWSDALANALERAAHFVFLVSPRSAASQNCVDEVGFALERDKPVLAVHLEPTRLSPGLALRLGSRGVWQGRLIGPAETRRFLDGHASATDIAGNLGVGSVLMGSVRQLGRNVRITMEFVNAAGERIWSERLQEPLDTIFDRVEYVGDRIVWSLGNGLREYQFKQVADAPEDELGPWELGVKAWRLAFSPYMDAGAQREHRRLVERAIGLEPNEAFFKAAFAATLANNVLQGFSADREGDARRARAVGGSSPVRVRHDADERRHRLRLSRRPRAGGGALSARVREGATLRSGKVAIRHAASVCGTGRGRARDLRRSRNTEAARADLTVQLHGAGLRNQRRPAGGARNVANRRRRGAQPHHLHRARQPARSPVASTKR